MYVVATLSLSDEAHSACFVPYPQLLRGPAFVIGLVMESLVFATLERVTVRRWGVQR